MDPIHDVVAQPIGTERTAIADPVAQDIPGVRQLRLVFPDDGGHLAKVMRLDLAEAERDHAGEPGVVGFQISHKNSAVFEDPYPFASVSPRPLMFSFLSISQSVRNPPG